MANIAQYLNQGRTGLVPNEIRSMKRLWDVNTQGGLLIRRDAEADLFQDGVISEMTQNALNGLQKAADAMK